MKKIISMLLAVAMVMSLCVNVFAITEKAYNNGANESVLQFTGTGSTDTREVKIVIFDSDQTQTGWTRGKVTLDPDAEEGVYPELTPAQTAQGYGYYRVRLRGRVLWPAASTVGFVSGGVFNLAIKNKKAGGANPYTSQDQVANRDIVSLTTIQGSTASADFDPKSAIPNYVGNMTNEEAAGIYKVRFPFAKKTGTGDGGTDAQGNKYWQFDLVFRGLLGKPGDQFEVSLSEFVDETGIPSFVFSKEAASGGSGRPSSVTAGTALITIPAEIKYDSNGGAPTEIRSITGAVEGTVDPATPTQQQYNFTRGTDVFIGWSDTKVAKAIETKAELDALSYFVKPGGELVVNSTIFANKAVYAVWAKNTLPTPVDGGGNPIPDDPENPGTQPVPDYKKVPVTFKIVGGKWKDANAASVTTYLMAGETTQTAALTNNHISRFVRNTAPHYVNLNNIERELGKDPAKGSWDTRPVATNLSISGATYTFTLGAKDPGYTYINGENGKDITPQPEPAHPETLKKGDPLYGNDVDNPGTPAGTPIKYIITDIQGPDGDNDYKIIAEPDLDGDGNPDRYQVNVTFKIDGGYWNAKPSNGTDNADKKISGSIKNSAGDWEWDDVNNRPVGQFTYTAQSTTNAGPDDDHDGDGAWDTTPPGVVRGQDQTGEGPYSFTYTYEFEEKDIIFIDPKNNQLEIVKILRYVGKDHASTGEPNDKDYDTTMVSATVFAAGSNKTALAGSAENVAKVKAYMTGAKYYRYTGSGYELLTGANKEKYMEEPVVAAKDGKVGITFTSKYSGVVKVIFNEGTPKQSEFVFFTPGDVNLNGDVNANDWAYIMRWLAENNNDTDPTPANSYKDFKVNGHEYSLWALMADMTSTEVNISNNVTDIKTYVDANDWAIIMFLLANAYLS